MLNFTVGPVQTFNDILNIGSEQVPYFRTDEFSHIMLENEKYIKKFIKASEDSKVVFLTGSGTAAMETSIINCLSKKDNVLIINGGSFGQRFVDICKLHKINYEELKLESGKTITYSDLENIDGSKFTALLVNVHETSTCVYYDMNIISDFCKKHNLFLIVDAISSFLADDFNMETYKADVVITSSQKALACPPGISILVLSNNALLKIEKNETSSFYFNLKDALQNSTRGQTPFTPAVSILLQIHKRLENIDKTGGVENEITRVNNLAKDFRKRIKDFPFEIYSNSLSNACTSLHPINKSAYEIFIELKNTYNIWICPNGGELKDKVLRVGHIGNLTISDNDKLFQALTDMKNKRLL